MTTAVPVRVLYVGGVPRSGSTLADLLLHQLSGHVGVGELFYLWNNCLLHDDLCSCGRRFSACEFWEAVGRQAFGGWESVDAAEVIRLQSIVDKTTAIPLLLSPYRPKAFQAALDTYSEILLRLYRAIATLSEASVVVDSSKRASMAFVLRTMGSVDLRVVQVVRDPRGVAFSFAKHVPLQPGVAVGSEMPRSTARKVSRRWVTVNALVASLGRLGVPLIRIRYEDLVKSPAQQLRRVLELEGFPSHAGDFDFLQADGVTLPQTHAVASGRIRLSSGTVSLQVDDVWRRDMPKPTRRMVSAITSPLRRRYGYQ